MASIRSRKAKDRNKCPPRSIHYVENRPSKMYLVGLNANKLLANKHDDEGTITSSDKFVLIPDTEITDIEIGWDYFLIWKKYDLYITGKVINNDDIIVNKLLKIPQCSDHKFKQVIPGPDKVTILLDNHDIWLYHIYEDTWEKVLSIFVSNVNNDINEHFVKIAQGRCTVALTNLGRVFNIPISLVNPSKFAFVDIACGFDHSILLSSTGLLYSTGIGTRGQLGHGNLEDSDEPRHIQVLSALKIKQISAGGWHSAVVTYQGDLYTWGWNNQGQLGQPDIENIVAIPTYVEFRDSEGKVLELNVSQVECGTTFTICKTNNGQLWGCGSNKYGQLGISKEQFPKSRDFILLQFDEPEGKILDLKCGEWSTYIRALDNKKT